MDDFVSRGVEFDSYVDIDEQVREYLKERFVFGNLDNLQAVTQFVTACLMEGCAGDSVPPLVITGQAGAGKSRLMRIVWDMIGGAIFADYSFVDRVVQNYPDHTLLIDAAREVPDVPRVAVSMRTVRCDVPDGAQVIKLPIGYAPMEVYQ